jgi:hypothetical protein
MDIVDSIVMAGAAAAEAAAYIQAAGPNGHGGGKSVAEGEKKELTHA